MPKLNDFPCTYSGCDRTFKRLASRTQHYNAQHRLLSPDSEPDMVFQHQAKYHPKLNALPCDINGKFLPQHTYPPPPDVPDATEDNPWHPFEDRLAFDWAHYHFVELQSSEREINKGLDLWLAAITKHGDDTPLPWSSTQEMYETIDSIQEGDAPFKTVCFKYSGPVPQNPPSWMTETYELCLRDSRKLLHNQLATTDFSDTFDYKPYLQFDHRNDRVWSNLMSGDWAWKEADTITKDKRTHGSMLVPIISGSDKTTVSVATGHQEYHPVYQSPGNLTNTARRAHGNSVLPVAFLPIPKTNKRQRKTPEFQSFTRQVYHMCLARIFAPLRAGMTVPDIVRCPDGHFRRAIYSLGPYIADYPEQVWLAGVVQGWCPKCEANPKDLDGNFDKTRRRRHKRTDFILTCFDPGIAWDKYGIRSDVVPFTHGFPHADIHTLLSHDLLHQLIKGTFKDHLVTWVNEYLFIKYGETQSQEIIHDIDRRTAAYFTRLEAHSDDERPRATSRTENDMDRMDVDSDGDCDAGRERNAGEELLDDAGPENGPQSRSSITLAATPERQYPKDLDKLAQYIHEPEFPFQFKSFLYSRRHPNRPIPDDLSTQLKFSGKIHVFHSATTRFYAPSDLCGPCGMYRQRIRCNSSWYGHPRRDTVFVVQDGDQPGMEGMLIARIHLLFSFVEYGNDEVKETVQCALVSWFLPASNARDPDTGMWIVKREGTREHQPIQVIPLKSIARGAHLLPKYGVGFLPDYITYINALDEFQEYFVNPYIDHHCHEFLSE